MSSRFVVPIVCFALGGGAGILVERHLVSRDSSQAAVSSPDSDGKTAPPHPSTEGKGGVSRNRQAGGSLARSLDELLKVNDAEFIEQFVRGLSLAEIQQALHHLQSQQERDALFLRTQLFRAWAAKDMDGAWGAALALSEKLSREFATSAVAGELAKSRPAAAVDLVMSLGMDMGHVRKRALREVFREWGQSDLPAALSYWKQHPELPVDSSILTSAISLISRVNPELALQQALTLPTAAARQSSVESVIGSWHFRDADAALRWALTKAEPDQRDTLLKLHIASVASQDPIKALELLNQPNFASVQKETQVDVFREWLRKDPSAVFDYLAANPEAAVLENPAFDVSGILQNLTLPSKPVSSNACRPVILRAISSGVWPISMCETDATPKPSPRSMICRIPGCGTTLCKSLAKPGPRTMPKPPPNGSTGSLIPQTAIWSSQATPQPPL